MTEKHKHKWLLVSKAAYNLKKCEACCLYQGAVYVPGRKLVTHTVRKELEDSLLGLKSDYKRGKLNPELKSHKPLTFSEACAKYTALYMIPNGQEQDRYQLPYFIDFFGGRTYIKSISTERLQELKARMLQDFAPTTFIRRWTLLNSVFRELIPTYLSSNPCKLISNKAVRKRCSRKETSRKRWFTNEQTQQIYQELSSYTRRHKNDPKTDNYTEKERRENVLYAVIARNTGLRPDSMDRLEWADLNLKTNLLVARKTKNSHTYEKVVNTAARKALLELWELKGKPSQGTVFRKASWSRIFTKLFKRLGWNEGIMKIQDRYCLYTFRHTFCSYLVMAGYSGKPLWDEMCWENGSEEPVYAHLSPKFKDTMVNTVSCAYEPLGDKLLEEAKRGKEDEKED